MSIQDRIQNRAAAAVERTGDQNEVETGGGPRKLVPEGKHKARLIGYIETGPQERNFNGEVKPPVNKFVLRFALFSKEARFDNGKPMTIDTKQMSVSRNEKATAVKLFRIMNPKRDCQHFMQLLGRVFWITVTHNPGKAKDGKDVTYDNIAKEGGIVPGVKDLLDDEDNVIGVQDIACEQAPDSMYQVLEWDVPSADDFNAASKLDQMRLRGSTAWAGSGWQALVGDGEKADSAGDNGATEAPSDEAPWEQESQPEVPAETSAEVSEDDMPPV